MKKDIQMRYCFDKQLTEAAIKSIVSDEMDILGVYTPVYFIDLGYGTYTQINNVEQCSVPLDESIIVQYEYCKSTDSNIFRICRFNPDDPVSGKVLYIGYPIYKIDEMGDVCFPPQNDILLLNKEVGCNFFEMVMIRTISKNYEFKKLFES